MMMMMFEKRQITSQVWTQEHQYSIDWYEPPFNSSTHCPLIRRSTAASQRFDCIGSAYSYWCTPIVVVVFFALHRSCQLGLHWLYSILSILLHTVIALQLKQSKRKWATEQLRCRVSFDHSLTIGPATKGNQNSTQKHRIKSMRHIGRAAPHSCVSPSSSQLRTHCPDQFVRR